MKLYLVQHGDAVSKQVDPDRPLNEQGIRDIERLASYLSKWGVRVPSVVHSGKARAQQTAQRLAAVLAIAEPVKAQSDLSPKDSPAAMIARLAGRTEDLLVVSHMPYLGKLATRLLTGSEDRALLAFVPGTLVAMQRSDEGKWSVIGMLRPDQIPE